MFLFGVAVGAGCETAGATATDTPYIITSTLPPTLGPTPAIPPTKAPAVTQATMQGATSTQVNVRTSPSSSSAPIGVVDAYAYVQIVGRDSSGNWYQIQYPKGQGGVGWVTSLYVNVQNRDAIPIMPGISGTGPSGVILQQVNVRSGPSIDSGTLGTLNPRDLVSLVGKDPSGLWLQIGSGTSGQVTGWVATGYVQASGIEQLPIIDQSGQVVGTATPTGIAPTPTPTPQIAPRDNDSAAAPAADIAFSPVGTGSMIYSSDLSAPTGDTADWVRFYPSGTRSSIRLDCKGEAPVELSLSLNGAVVEGLDLPACGATRILVLSTHSSYLLELDAEARAGQQSYVRYVLTIANLP